MFALPLVPSLYWRFGTEGTECLIAWIYCTAIQPTLSLIFPRYSFALAPASIAAHLSAAHTSDVPLADKRIAIETWEGRNDLSARLYRFEAASLPQAALIQYPTLYNDGISFVF
jgi:hypothetical protein